MFVVDWDEMENAEMASAVHVKRVAAKEVVAQTNATFPLAEGSCRQPATHTSDRAQLRGGRRRSKPFRTEEDKEDDDGDEPLPSNDDGILTDSNQQQESDLKDFWVITQDCLIKVHERPRVALYVPTEGDCPLPLKYIDVDRKTFFFQSTGCLGSLQPRGHCTHTRKGKRPA